MIITFEFLGETITIKTPSNSPDEYAIPEITVPPDLREGFDLFLTTTPLYGHYGHLVDLKSACTNLDLQSCFYVQDFQKETFPFKLISVEPQIFPDPNFPPPGAVS